MERFLSCSSELKKYKRAMSEKSEHRSFVYQSRKVITDFGLGLLADVSRNAAVNVQNVAVYEVGSFGAHFDHGDTLDDACIVHQNVNAAQIFFDLLNQSNDVFFSFVSSG